jgi:glycosyltransferase involved in cell wall biosynthesis
VRLLYLGRVVRAKGVFACVDAVQILNCRGRAAELTVAGDGEDLVELKSYVTAKGIEGIRFLGEVRGRRRLDALGLSDLMLLPTSHGEGLPTSALEGLLYGLTPIVTTVGGLRDLASWGLPVETIAGSRPSTIADAVEAVVTDLDAWRVRSIHGHRMAIQLFTPELVAADLRQVYCRVQDGSDEVVHWYDRLP